MSDTRRLLSELGYHTRPTCIQSQWNCGITVIVVVVIRAENVVPRRGFASPQSALFLLDVVYHAV